MSMVTCSWKCQWLLRKQSNHYCQEPLVYRLTSSLSEIFLQLAKGTRIPLLSHHQQRWRCFLVAVISCLFDTSEV